MISQNNIMDTQFEYTIIFSKNTMKDVNKIMKNKKLMERLQEILDEIKFNPYLLSFKFEKLKYNNSGL
jgi:Txe/YoeB family toxin of Txe-Axe toxin-antitoxin module